MKSIKLITLLLGAGLSVIIAGCAANKENTADEKPNVIETAIPPYERGVVTDTGYESQWWNLRFTPPDNAEMVPPEKLTETYDQENLVVEMAVSNPNNTSSVLVLADSRPEIEGDKTSSMSAEECAKNGLAYRIANMQDTFTHSDVTTKEIAGASTALRKYR